MAETLFYLLGALALLFAVGVVKSKMPLFSVLNLLGTFLCLSGIYLLAGFPFLAATQVLVYAGAIMVLFLFVIMLLNLGDAAELARHVGASLSGTRLFVAGVSATLLALLGLGAASLGGAPALSEALPDGKPLDDLTRIAEALFTRYVLPFEAASLLLLATMVGVIVLAKRQRGETPTPRADVARPASEPEEPRAAVESGAAR